MKKYLFSDTKNSQDLFFGQVSCKEMNNDPRIKLMIANTGYRAMENYKAICPDFYNTSREYTIDDKDLLEVKDSNINPKEMCGFLLENKEGKPISIILAGISKEPLRVMMGTINTVKEFEGRGYFSILFDETIKTIAQQNGDQLPQVLISERGVTSRGQNFDTYLGILNNRNFTIQALERKIVDIDPNLGYITHDLNNVLLEFNLNLDPDVFQQDKTLLKKVVEKQQHNAFFLHGLPREMTLKQFADGANKRLEEKVSSRKIAIDSNKKTPNSDIKNPHNICSDNNKGRG